ncbi:RNA polymerase sigma factor [Fodinibius halophilus]|uniref:RNA polymerase sigma factor n=1 Tax=Fodinibius halophilus TaxID=1736908 RepID=A0A6M1TFL8_9BACT|nr:RNA polymerase sigma factor [Fodinibius halophilus]NGP87430.1 RNA polymerase sigma factor [Fodinibius halophilus]
MTEQKQEKIFKHWLDNHKALLFKVVRAYAFSPKDHDDLFQEIAIQVWRSIPNFKKNSAVTTWLYRIALNTAMKWTRKETKHHDGHSSFDDFWHLLHKKETDLDPRLDWLYEQISQLDKIDRSITLLMLDGFSYKEMSHILGLSVSHIGVKIHRIKKHLISLSEDYEHHEI